MPIFAQCIDADTHLVGVGGFEVERRSAVHEPNVSFKCLGKEV